MKTFGTAVQHCPKCDHPFEAATSTTGQRAPQAGDLSVCIECGNLMTFTANRTRRALTEPERQSALANPDVQRVLAALALVVGDGRKH